MSGTYLGWTKDPAILAIMDDLLGTEDERVLSNRKDGGVHCVWAWPLGHYWDEDWDGGPADEPIWSRVDVCHGRYLSDGMTFLIWDDEMCRAGTLEDADWLRRGVRGETRRTQARFEREEAMNAQRKAQGEPPIYDFAALLPRFRPLATPRVAAQADAGQPGEGE